MKLIAPVLCMTLVLAGSVKAVPLTWYLSGVTFNDGGRAFGSFVYDADTNQLSSIKVTTTPGKPTAAGLLAGRDYTDLLAYEAGDLNSTGLPFQETGPQTLNGVSQIVLHPATGLTNAGGTISLIYSEEDAIVFSPTFQDTSRFTTAGKVIAASATGPKTWYLTGLTFDDGGQAIGSFVYDSVSNTYSQINIQTTAGNTLSATTYIAPYSPLSNSKNLTVIGAQTPVAGGRVLNLTLSSPLPGTGGSVNVSTASTSAEGTCVSATCAANGNVAFLGVLRNVTSGVLTTTRPAGYSRVVSQVVDGGATSPWRSSMVFTNLAGLPSVFTAHFFSDSGVAANVPGLGSVVTSVVPAHGVLVLPSTASSPVLTQAWARVDNAQSFAVSALVILKNANAAGDQQAAVYGDPLDTYSVAVPFDNTGGATNGLALVNPDPTQSATVYVIGYDSMGNVILNDSSISLPPLGHIAFVFAAQPGFSPLATGQGSIRVFAEPNVAAPAAPFHGINALLIKALPNLSYTNVSVVNR